MSDRYNPKEIVEIFEHVRETVDDLHENLSHIVQGIGYIREVTDKSEDYWVSLAHKAQTDPSVLPTVASGVEMLYAFDRQLLDVKNQSRIPEHQINTAFGTAALLSATTHSISSVITIEDIDQVPLIPYPFPEDGDQVDCANRLARIDPALGDTYRAIWESLYGTRADPERAALYLMRQAFDHLFDHLAPDEDVRASEYWEPKAGDDPKQIYRRERVEYAAYTHISDKNQASVLAASTKQVLEVYNSLNYAHCRGELNPQKARSAILSAEEVLRRWAKALDL